MFIGHKFCVMLEDFLEICRIFSKEIVTVI